MQTSPHLLRAGLLALATLATLATASAGGPGWTSDFAAAKQQAATENKDILLDFTGSDWCGWCIKLDKEVFQQDAFKTGVKDTLVLVDLDFPREPANQAKLSAATKAQNDRLREQFKIQGFPSLFLCDASGKAYAQTDYQPGGPVKYVARLNELMAVRAKRDAAFAAAEKATSDEEKVKFLVAGLSAMDPGIVDVHYADVVTRITHLDKDDRSGFFKARKEATTKEAAVASVGAKVQEFMQGKVGPLMQAKDFDKAYAVVQDYIKSNPTLPDDIKVGLTLNIGLSRFVEKGDQIAADKFVEEVIAMFPNHNVAKHGDEIKQQVSQQIKMLKARAEGAAPTAPPQPE